MNNKERYGELFCTMYAISQQEEGNIFVVNPKKLLVKERMDLISKILWAEAKKQEINNSFLNYFYLCGIDALTHSAYIEFNNKQKDSKVEYLNSFSKLYENIKKEGFDNKCAIPVGENNAILDGAHRLAISFAENIEIPIQRFPKSKIRCNAEDLRKRNMNQDMIDFSVLNYLMRKNDVRCFCLWPAAYDTKKRTLVESILKEHNIIIYKKEVSLTDIGLRNLCIRLYSQFSWKGEIENHYLGVSYKSDGIYKKNKTCIFYFLENISKDELLDIKNKVRDIFDIDKQSCHSTDTDAETVDLAKIILNKNTINLFNNKILDFNIDLNSKINKIINENKDNLGGLLILTNIYNEFDKTNTDINIEFINLLTLENKKDLDDYYEFYINPNKHFFYKGIKFVCLGNINNTSEKNRFSLKLFFVWMRKKSILTMGHLYAFVLRILIKNQSIYNFALKVKNRITQK